MRRTLARSVQASTKLGANVGLGRIAAAKQGQSAIRCNCAAQCARDFERKWGPGLLPGPTLAHTSHVRFGDCRFRVGGGGLLSMFSGDCSPRHLGRLGSACAFLRLSVATFPAALEGLAIIVRSAIVGVGSFPPGRDAEASRGSRGKDPDSRTVSVCFRRGPRSGRNLFASSASADPGGACLRRGSKSGRGLPSSSASASTGGCPYRLFTRARYSVSVGPEDLLARCRSVRSKPHQMQKTFLLLMGLRPDPQSFSHFRPMNAAPRNRVAQALFIHVIHRPRWNGG